MINSMKQIKLFCQMVRYIWRDSRVPVLARIYVVCSALYWINPFNLIPDLIPDCQAGGLYDDVLIFCFLILLALRLIPLAVFHDLRKAKLLGRRAAAFGVLYITIAGSFSCHARTCQPLTDHSAQILESSLSTSCSRSASDKRLAQQIMAKACHRNVGCFELSKILFTKYLVDSCVSKSLIPALLPERELLFNRHGPPALLIKRGGQYQLYASEDDSARQASCKTCVSISNAVAFNARRFCCSSCHQLSMAAIFIERG